MSDPFYDLRINQELDSQLAPCPTCHHEYAVPRKRLGPTCVDCFEGDKVNIKCLNCWTKSEPANSQTEAMKLWNNGKVKAKTLPANASPLRKARDKMHMTQREFAAYLGVPVGAYKNYELGHCNPTVINAKRIYDKLGIGSGKTNRYLYQRNVLGMTQSDVCSLAHVDHGIIIKLEHGGTVNPSQLERVQQVLGMV